MISRALAIALALAVAMPASAKDFDARWIDETLGSRRPERREVKRAHRVPERTHRAHAKPRREARRAPPPVERDPEPRRDPEPEPEHVPRTTCMQPVNAISHERLTSENAWEDARRTWMNAVRWAYGERFMAIEHAEHVVRLCNISAASQNVTGRIGEAVRDAIGTEAGGNRWRCEITAQPCMAPREPGSTR